MSTRLEGLDQARAELSEGRPALVWRTIVADTETPVSAALKLFEEGRGDFVLESVEGGETRGRYSLIGIAPDLVFRARGDDAEINRDWQTDREAFAPCEGGALDALRTLAGGVAMQGEMDRLFTDSGVVEPLDLSVTRANGVEVHFDGYLAVAEDRLAGLDGAALERLARAGLLGPAYHAAASLANFRTLIALDTRGAR